MKISKALALTVGGGMLLLPSVAQNDAPSEPRASAELTLPSSLLPFSLDQVLNHFNEAFEKRPSRIDERTFGYTDRENSDEMVIITISDLDTGLAIVLLATGDYGVNYMREFFEAPFFLREETEQFYKLLEQGPGVSHAGSWLIAALEFGPVQIYRPELAATGNSHVDSRKAWQPKAAESERLSPSGIVQVNTQ